MENQTIRQLVSRTGEQYVYQYDEMGNRKLANEPLVQNRTYSANALNQYSAITNPDPAKRVVKGKANPFVSVKLSQTLMGQQPPALPVQIGQVNGSYTVHQFFSGQAVAPTTNGPAYLKVSLEGSRTLLNSSAWLRPDHQPVVYLQESGFYFPPKNETPLYDEDGNLTRDGRWDWAWDAENRLRSVETTAASVASGVPRQRLEFVYDSQSRRVRKVVKGLSATTGGMVVTSDTRYLYDGWNVIAEFSVSPGVPVSSPPRLVATYAWGLDLSGTETGAGGVGGLVLESLYQPATTSPQISATLAPLYDGNGNVLAYAACSTGQVMARYEYDPFGKLLIKDEDPTVAGRLHHQFSTKYCDGETGLSYYGYRYYSAELGRWVSRDPIGERGGINLYGMLMNNAVGNTDILGLECACETGGCDAEEIDRLAAVVAQHIVTYAGGTESTSAEYAGVVCCIKRKAEASGIYYVGQGSGSIQKPYRECENRGGAVVAVVHNHPGTEPQVLTDQPLEYSMDYQMSEGLKIPSYMGDSTHQVSKYDPCSNKETGIK